MINFIKNNTFFLTLLISLLLVTVGTLFLTELYTDKPTINIKNQYLSLIIGLVIAVISYNLKLSYSFCKRYYWIPLFLVSVALFYLAFLSIINIFGFLSIKEIQSFPFVFVVNNGVRWLNIAGFSIQPSEFARLAIIIFIAYYFGKTQAQRVNKKLYLGIPIIVISFVIALILAGRSLSLSLSCLFIFSAILFISDGIDRKVFKWLILIGLIVIGSFFLFLKSDPKKFKRFQTWSNEIDNSQLRQSKFILNQSSFFGSHSRRYKTIPLSFSDMSSTSLISKWGLLGLFFVAFLFLALFIFSITMANKTKETIYKFLLVGISLNFIFSFVFQLAVACGLLPTTGIVIPFFSFGGSNLIVSLISLGLLLNIAKNIP